MTESRLVLIFEPNTRDALSLEQAFKRQSTSNPARVLRHVPELTSYLDGAGLYANRELFPIPSLLILDFTQSVTSINILEWLRQRGLLNHFPVIGIGPHIGSHVMQLAFDLGMNGYFVKETDLNSLAKTIAELYWVDGWQAKLSDSAKVNLITRDEFYRISA